MIMLTATPPLHIANSAAVLVALRRRALMETEFWDARI